MFEEDLKEAPFWLVWSRRGEPTQKHFDKGEAMAEAQRLSKKHIDSPFYIAEVNFGYISHALTTRIHLVEEEK